MNEDRIERITKSTSIISRWSQDFLQLIGISDSWITYINPLFLLAVIVIIVIIVQVLTRKILTVFFYKIEKIKKSSFVKYLINRRVAHYLAIIVPFSIIKGSIPIIFEEFEKLMILANKATDIYVIFYIIWLIMAIISAFGDSLKDRENLKDKPIDSYLQVLKIFLYFIGFIVIFSILSGKNPIALITGLGAMSAVLMLVFKDTILGFVASIQVSSNDMVRIGDWITVPKHEADGDVIQISLTTVKIKNFDNTITTIPPYSLVSDSFQNWRGMKDAGTRRIKRSIYIKQSSVAFVSEDRLEEYNKIQYIRDYIATRQEDINNFNQKMGADKSLLVNGRSLSNLGLFRKYIENYLKSNAHIKQDMPLMVRQLGASPKGIPLEIYAFANTTVWTEYEEIISDIFDHILASVKYFNLEIYEDISNTIMGK